MTDKTCTAADCPRQADLAIRTTASVGVKTTMWVDLEEAPKVASFYCAQHGSILVAELALMSIGSPLIERSPSVGYNKRTWKPGERVVIPGRDGSYPAKSKDRWGYIVSVEEYMMVHSRVWVQMDDEHEPRAINPDVLRHEEKHRV